MRPCSCAAIFAGIGAATGNGAGAAVTLVAGVLAGSIMWLLLLTCWLSLLHARIGPSVLHGINRVSGGILLAFALVALAGLR